VATAAEGRRPLTAGDESYPMLVEAEGTPPPQYPDFDDDLDEKDDAA